MICAKCELENSTLHWMETATGFVCIGCATGRRAEQVKLDKKFEDLNIKIKPKQLGKITQIIVN
jgi:hypothetical protein